MILCSNSKFSNVYPPARRWIKRIVHARRPTRTKYVICFRLILFKIVIFQPLIHGCCQLSAEREGNIETELTVDPPPSSLPSGPSASAHFGVVGLGFPPNAVSRIARAPSSPLASSPSSSLPNSPSSHINTFSPSPLLGPSITKPAISAPFPVMSYTPPGLPPFSPTYSPSAQSSPPSSYLLNSQVSSSMKPGAYRSSSSQMPRISADARMIPNSSSNLSAGGNSFLTPRGSKAMILYRLSATEDGLLPPQFGNPRDRANRNSASGDSIMSLGADSRRHLINESFVSSSILGSRGGTLSVNEVGLVQGGLVAYAYDPYEDADADELYEEEEQWVRGHAAGYIGTEPGYHKVQPGSGTATPQFLEKKFGSPLPPPLTFEIIGTTTKSCQGAIFTTTSTSFIFIILVAWSCKYHNSGCADRVITGVCSLHTPYSSHLATTVFNH